jgi:formylmethanofuran dehydrogenase subunit E
MDEKDRLGETLREKGKAEEDRYFAEQDKKLKEKLQQKLAEEEEAKARKLALMRCPKCGESMRRENLLGVSVETCPGCNGVFLDPGELEHVVEHDRKTGWLTRYLDRIRGE